MSDLYAERAAALRAYAAAREAETASPTIEAEAATDRAFLRYAAIRDQAEADLEPEPEAGL
jgi:hypothetical protein